jgi:DNA polymerase-3 subunit epsilon
MNELHRNYSDQRAAIDWARKVLTNKYYVILDTETTGLGSTDEIIELCIINTEANVLFNERIKPTRRKRIAREATDIHGIKMSDLRHCPTFSQLQHKLSEVLKGKKVVSYNADYDKKLYKQTYQIAGGYLPNKDWECAMLQYAKFVGEWNPKYNEYKWQKLKGGDHSALGDCLATLTLLQKMASAKKLKRWYEFWVGA